ncbi:hypothetical protein ACF0H5_000213 [Mactra antiquata]
MSASAECGIGRCEPSLLRKWANIKCFTGVYSVTGLLTASLSMYIISQITSIEKQFGLSSSKTGYLMACNDIGYSLCILIASYFSNRVHIPRFLSVSTMFYGVSGIICSLPHFMFKPAPIAVSSATNPMPMFSMGSNICRNKTDYASMPMMNNMSSFSGPSDTTGSVDSTASNVTMALIAIGMVLQGIGKAPRYPMLAQYLDDNTSNRDTGYYMGIITSTAIFGPAIAYGLGGLFSRIYVTLEDVDLHPMDPRWIGAWWLGFLAFGIIAIIVAVPLLCFPAKLKKSLTVKSRTPAESRSTTGTICQEFVGVFKSILKVLRVPAFSLMLFAMIVNVLGMSAGMSFGPKYLEKQFNIPAWHANIILAAVGIPSVCLGSFIGGLLTKKIKLNPPNCIILILCTQIPSIALQIISMFLNCDQPEIYNWSDQRSSSLPVSCSDSCNCGTTFLPVCDSQGFNYFSPCHAGCSQGSFMKFTNCTCIPDGEVSTGLCQFKCNMLWPFMIVSFFASFISSCMMMPIFIFNMRIVPNKLKAMAIGISALSMSLFALLPGPVIGGKLVDHACVLWSNGDSGSCTFYNIDTLRFNLFGLGICGRAVSIILVSLILKITWNMTEWPGTLDKMSEVDFVIESDKKKTNKELLPEMKSLK